MIPMDHRQYALNFCIVRCQLSYFRTVSNNVVVSADFEANRNGQPPNNDVQCVESTDSARYYTLLEAYRLLVVLHTFRRRLFQRRCDTLTAPERMRTFG